MSNKCSILTGLAIQVAIFEVPLKQPDTHVVLHWANAESARHLDTVSAEASSLLSSSTSCEGL